MGDLSCALDLGMELIAGPFEGGPGISWVETE
jgi:hypothetical protein